MKFRVLSALPALFVAMVFLALHFVQGSPAYPAFLRGEITVMKVSAVVGSLAAALSLERGEHLRRAWAFTALGNALFLVRDALAPARSAVLGISPADARAGVLVVANLISVVGVLWMAQTYRIAGVEPPGSPRKRALALGAAGLVAILLTGPSLWADMLRIGHGGLETIPRFVASACDLASFCLIAPVLLTALAFRGGVLYFPWALLATSQIGWLLFDAMGSLDGRLPLSPAGMVTLAEILRALACAYSCSAGLAQRAVVTRGPTEALASTT